MELLNQLSLPRANSLFVRKSLPAACSALDLIGTCVYITGEYSGGLYPVAKANPADATKMPAVGIIVSKSSPTSCLVQYVGEVVNVYSALTNKKPLFVGLGGQLTDVPPVPSLGGYAFVQTMGMTTSSNRLILVPSFFMTKRVG